MMVKHITGVTCDDVGGEIVDGECYVNIELDQETPQLLDIKNPAAKQIIHTKFKYWAVALIFIGTLLALVQEIFASDLDLKYAFDYYTIAHVVIYAGVTLLAMTLFIRPSGNHNQMVIWAIVIFAIGLFGEVLEFILGNAGIASVFVVELNIMNKVLDVITNAIGVAIGAFIYGKPYHHNNHLKTYIPMEGVRVTGDYMCSESALATIRMNEHIALPSEEELVRCYSYDTIQHCLPNWNETDVRPENVEEILESGRPILVSIIPLGQTETHTSIINGIDDDNYYTISDGGERVVSKKRFEREWRRTNFRSMIQD